MVWLPMVKKFCVYVIDTQTPHDGIGRAYASHCAAKIPDISLTAVKFLDISRFSRQVITLIIGHF